MFIIFFQGDQLKTRVKKICEGFRATLYPCPEAPTDRREMAMGVMTRIEDLNTVSIKTLKLPFSFQNICQIYIAIKIFFLGFGANPRPSPSSTRCCGKKY